jgi:hypothetical protein
MMWKNASKTAFGLISRDDMMVIVGYYCYDKPTFGVLATMKKNVG